MANEYTERPLCCIDGCTNLAKINRVANGRTLFKKWCRKHHDEHYGIKRARDKIGALQKRKNKFKNLSCEICGWDKGYCHRHRLKHGSQGGEYITGNVVSLCPNCHQLEHIHRKK